MMGLKSCIMVTHIVKKGLSKSFKLIMNSLKFSIIARGFSMVISGYPKNARFQFKLNNKELEVLIRHLIDILQLHHYMTKSQHAVCPDLDQSISLKYNIITKSN